MARVVPLVKLRLGAAPLPVLLASDAMGASAADAGGFGIVAQPVAENMWRDVFLKSKSVSKTVAMLCGGSGGLKYPQRVIATKPVSLVPLEVFNTAEWFPIQSGRWAFEDHITWVRVGP